MERTHLRKSPPRGAIPTASAHWTRVRAGNGNDVGERSGQDGLASLTSISLEGEGTMQQGDDSRKWLLPGLFIGMVLMARPVSADTHKKLIEFGWDEPTTAFLREHIAEMEQM